MTATQKRTRRASRRTGFGVVGAVVASIIIFVFVARSQAGIGIAFVVALVAGFILRKPLDEGWLAAHGVEPPVPSRDRFADGGGGAAHVDDGARGSRSRVPHCTRCGGAVDGHYRYCPRCGLILDPTGGDSEYS